MKKMVVTLPKSNRFDKGMACRSRGHEVKSPIMTTATYTPWYLYMVRCADDTLYTGITTDVQRRIDEHNGDDRIGARYTRTRRPVELVYTEQVASRAAAASREAAIKKLTRQQKLALFNG